jgi:hypothetical protein
MTKSTTIQFASALTAWARVNQLEAMLSLPLSAEQPNINLAWNRIDELEAKLADLPEAQRTSTPPASKPNQPKAAPAAQSPSETDPIKPAPELTGLARATHANRDPEKASGKLIDAMPKTGWGRAARAQQAINNRKIKS